MPSQTETANEIRDEYLTLEAPATLDDIDYFQHADAGPIISRAALRSGPKTVRAALLALSAAGVLTIGGVGARIGPRVAKDDIARGAGLSDGRVGDLLAKIEGVKVAHTKNAGYPEADAKAIKLARWWSAEMPSAAEARGLRWAAPSVAANPFGEVVFEWWNQKKTLAVYFDDAAAKFVRSPGTGIADMTDGEVKDQKHFAELLGWLLKKKSA